MMNHDLPRKGIPFNSARSENALERFGVLLMVLEELSVKIFDGPFATTRRTHGHGTPAW
jgi:hypothetical protein